jgi:hypothetical protein
MMRLQITGIFARLRMAHNARPTGNRRTCEMSDPDIGALRAKIASRPRPADFGQRRKDIDQRGLDYGTAGDVSVEKVDANGVAA